MSITRRIRVWACSILIGIAAGCCVSNAADEDGTLCVRGSGEAAIEACTRSINSDRYDKRNLALIYSNRAIQKEQMGKYEEALADHAEAIRIDPAYSAGYMHRGNMYARRGDYERAIADHSEAIRLEPKDADAYYNRGFTFSHKSDHERAVADYTIGIGLNANHARLWGQRCWSRAVVGKQLPEALDDCNKANALAPKIPQIFGYRGFVYLKLGQFDKAIADYDVALTMTSNPKNAEWLFGRGTAKLKKGDANGGKADLESAKAIKADIADQYAKLGVN